MNRPATPNKNKPNRDILLLVALIVPLAIGGVIWGSLVDFSEPQNPAALTPTVDPNATPSATPISFVIDHIG